MQISTRYIDMFCQLCFNYLIQTLNGSGPRMSKQQQLHFSELEAGWTPKCECLKKARHRSDSAQLRLNVRTSWYFANGKRNELSVSSCRKLDEGCGELFRVIAKNLLVALEFCCFFSYELLLSVILSKDKLVPKKKIEEKTSVDKC